MVTPVVVSRILIGVFFINEAVVAATSKSDELKGLKVPLVTSLSGLLILVPFFFALDLPSWLGWLVVALQAGGLALEMLSELQLVRAKSFAVSAGGATHIQSDGMYRFLENPIYLGILLQVTMWALWMPVVLITVALFYIVVRGMVASERQFLTAQHSATHRGIDSFLWN